MCCFARRSLCGIFASRREGRSAIFDDGTIWDLVAYVATLQPEALGEAT